MKLIRNYADAKSLGGWNLAQFLNRRGELKKCAPVPIDTVSFCRARRDNTGAIIFDSLAGAKSGIGVSARQVMPGGRTAGPAPDTGELSKPGHGFFTANRSCFGVRRVAGAGGFTAVLFGAG